MNLSKLKPAEGSVQTNKRLGRGQGSGRGGTSTRGHKGDGSRSGFKHKRGFEGGQMPIQRRVPKFGFHNFNRVEYKAINLDNLQYLATEKGIKSVDKQILVANGLIPQKGLYKVLGRGELKSSLEVKANAFSASAKAAIEANGGTVVII